MEDQETAGQAVGRRRCDVDRCQERIGHGDAPGPDDDVVGIDGAAE